METTTVSTDTALGGVSITIPVDTNFERLIMQTGSYEPVLERALHEELAADSVYYDVGSRWGYFTKLAVNRITDGGIHGFDANPMWFHLLKQNHDQNHVTLNNVYVSDSCDTRTITLDNYLETATAPDAVKIDVEGAEAAVVRGMPKLLKSVQPTIFIEVHPEYLRDVGDSVEVLFKLLQPIYDLSVAIDHRDDGDQWKPLNEVELPDTGDYLIRGR